MIIELNKLKFALNFGSDLEYISTFMKGKTKPRDKNQLIERYRILAKNIKTDEKILLYIDERQNFFGKDRYMIESIDDLKFITPTHIKNKVYNYYDIGFDPQTVESLFEAWKLSDPMVHIGNYQHQFISQCSGYTWAYKFNNKSF